MEQPNILLIVMDTARADYVESPSVMPNLAEFAEDGEWFTRTFANAPWTLPSHSSLFTGRYTSDHGTTGAEKAFDAAPTVMSELEQVGYQTVAFSNNPWISPDFGFTDFQEFVPCWQPFKRGADLAGVSQAEGLVEQFRQLAGELTGLDAPFTLANALYMKLIEGTYDSGAALTNFRIERWLDNRTTENPFFAFVNYMEPHLEYNPPRSHREQFVDATGWDEVNQDPWALLTGTVEMDDDDFAILQDLYRAELHYLDARLERLFSLLERRGELDSTVVVVTGDHGEHLGEQGLMDHQYSLSDALLRVPLLVRYPDAFERGTRTDDLVELRDLYPTLLSLAGIADPTAGMDHPPVDLTDPASEREVAIAEYLSPQPSIDTLCDRYDVPRERVAEYDRALRTIRTGDRAYTEGSDGTERLLKDDQPVEESGTDLADRLQRVLGEFAVADDDERDLAESNKQRLEDLGYL